MKQYIYVLLASAFLFSSCLNKDLENALDEDDIDFTQSGKMFEPVAGVYFEAAQCFSDWTGYALMSIRGQDIYKGSDATDQAELSNAQRFEYSLVSNYWALDTSFKNYYYIVMNANAALIMLDKYRAHLTTEEQLKLNSEFKAEVRFLRAYAYFFLARMWGDVPMVYNNDDVVTGLLSKTKHADVMQYIIDEIDAIEQDLQPLRPNEMSYMDYKGRVTRYSALGLKAKVCADINDWDAVLIETNKIVGSNKFELYPDFYQYFKIPGKFSNENLYEMQFSDLKQGSGAAVYSSAWFEHQAPRAGFLGDDALIGGWGLLNPNQALVKYFEDRGEKNKVRGKTLFLYAGSTTAEGDVLKANTGENAITNGKTYVPKNQMTPGRLNYGLGNNVRVLRYADILLLNAEAKVRKGQNGDQPFNLVRVRAEMTPITNVTVDQILDERRAEFAGEWGERYYDLVRTDKAATVLPGFVKGKSEYYPIPQAQIDLNPNLR